MAEEASRDHQDTDDDFEMDVDVKDEQSESSSHIYTSLDPPSTRRNINKFTKFCSSQELVDETERVFKNITNFSLREKLVLSDSVDRNFIKQRERASES